MLCWRAIFLVLLWYWNTTGMNRLKINPVIFTERLRKSINCLRASGRVLVLGKSRIHVRDTNKLIATLCVKACREAEIMLHAFWNSSLYKSRSFRGDRIQRNVLGQTAQPHQDVKIFRAFRNYKPQAKPSHLEAAVFAGTLHRLCIVWNDCI